MWRTTLSSWADPGGPVSLLKTRFEIPKDKLVDFCRRWKVVELSLFGSVLRDDFGPESDIDVLVSFAPDAHWTLFDMVDMDHELEEIFGRAVDLLTRRGVEASRNPYRKASILSSLEVIYGA